MTSTTLHSEFKFYQVARLEFDGYVLPMKIDDIINPLQTGAVLLLTEEEAAPWLAGGAVLPLHSQRAE